MQTSTFLSSNLVVTFYEQKKIKNVQIELSFEYMGSFILVYARVNVRNTLNLKQTKAFLICLTLK